MPVNCAIADDRVDTKGWKVHCIKNHCEMSDIDSAGWICMGETKNGVNLKSGINTISPMQIKTS